MCVALCVYQHPVAERRAAAVEVAAPEPMVLAAPAPSPPSPQLSPPQATPMDRSPPSPTAPPQHPVAERRRFVRNVTLMGSKK